jgi:hypothetical protein
MVFSPRPTDDQLRAAYQAMHEYTRMSEAAIALGITVSALKNRVRMYEESGLAETAPAAPIEPVSQVAMDVIERHRLKDEIRRLRDINLTLTARLSAAEDHRTAILGIPAVPPEPTVQPRETVTGKHKQAVVLHLSDLHVGEVVQRSEVMDANQYDVDIAKARLARLFNTLATLTTTAWPAADPAPEKIYILLGGDLISGHGLHPDHERTDQGTAYEQVKWCSDAIAGGILLVHAAFQEKWGYPVEIIIISVAGNHGRDTFGKPRTMLVSLQSYDTLVSDFVEAGLKNIPTVSHFRPRGFDAYFDACGWPLLLTHGDRMGSGGGVGFIGPSAAIIKGHRKILDTEHRQRRPVYRVFSGHFHTTCVTPFGFGNGAGIGYGEFAKSIRADPEPAQQNFVVFHERIGVLRWHPIAMGDPSEGAIYQPTAGLILPNIEGY